jgi:hypothetical protein
MKRPDGVIVIALWYLLVAFGMGIAALTLLVIPIPAVWFNTEGIDRMWAMWGLGIGLVLVAAPSILALITGIGLLKLQGWARWLALGLALLMLFAFPIGTLAGMFTIWYLLQDSVKAAFTPHAPMTAAA